MASVSSSSSFDAAIAAIFQRQPGRMVPDLDRITDLAELLGNPQTTFDTITVTGTNGKTSIAAMLASLCTAAGLIPGSYSSPHLQSVTERIRVAGVPIAEEDLARHIAYLQPFLDVVDPRHDDTVTFFEVLTALAILHFVDVPVNVAVLEVGMGGTWDATNVVDAAVAVIGRISLDHPELGPTVADKAAEKAGIIKPGSFAVCAAQEPSALSVIRDRADAMDAVLKIEGVDFELLGRAAAVGGQQVDLQGVGSTHNEVFLPLYGRHQAVNAALALAAFEAYHRFEVELDPELVREGFAGAQVPGRLEAIPREGQSLIVLDGAHNPAGIASLAAALTQDFAFERRVAVLGILEDKDVEEMVQALAPAVDHVVAVAPDNVRAGDPSRITAVCDQLGLSCEEADDVDHALDLADGVTRPSDGVVVTGSLFLVGEARELLGLDPA